MDASELAVCRECHCLAARRLARAVTRLYEERLRPHGLRATQFSILAALALKGPTPMGDLAELLGLERTTLTRSAGLMQRNGWLKFARSGDARERLLEASAAGRSKLERAFPAWQEAQEAMSRRLAENEKLHFPRQSALTRRPDATGEVYDYEDTEAESVPGRSTR